MANLTRRQWLKVGLAVGGMVTFGLSYRDVAKRAIDGLLNGTSGKVTRDRIFGNALIPEAQAQTHWQQNPQQTIAMTQCFGCWTQCGIRARVNADGKVIRIAGNPYHPLSQEHPIDSSVPFSEAMEQLERNSVVLHQHERALETARQMSVLGEMTSGFAHELNQPLSAIRHYAQGCLIRLRAADEQHPLLPALEQIDQQAQRGADTLRNLRHWVSQAQGNPVLTEAWKAIAIREAIDHVWQLLRMAQQFPTVTLHTEVSAALRVTLPSVLLEQVLANIILNAAQAGATHLWIVAERTENGISIVLQDNAGGIDEALLRQAFQPFMTTRKEGMGLGLAICQRLVRYGRGDISIRNQTAPDGLSGTVVTIHFLHEHGGRDGDNSSTG